MPPRARASRAPQAAPDCAAVRSQRHRPAIIALPASLRGILRNSPASVSAVASPALPLRLSQPSLGAAYRRRPAILHRRSSRRPGDTAARGASLRRASRPASDHAASRCAAASIQLRPATDAATRPSRLLRALRQPSFSSSETALRYASSAPPPCLQQCACCCVCRGDEGAATPGFSSPLLDWPWCLLSAPQLLPVLRAAAVAASCHSRCRRIAAAVEPARSCMPALLCGEASAEPSARVRCFCPRSTTLRRRGLIRWKSSSMSPSPLWADARRPRAMSVQRPPVLGRWILPAWLGVVVVCSCASRSKLPPRSCPSRVLAATPEWPSLRLQRLVCVRAFRLCVWPAAVPVCGGLIRDRPQRRQRRRRRRGAYGCSDKCAPSGGALHSASCESTRSHRSGERMVLPASALIERRRGNSRLQRSQSSGNKPRSAASGSSGGNATAARNPGASQRSSATARR
jgi:hypothetical protein